MHTEFDIIFRSNIQHFTKATVHDILKSFNIQPETLQLRLSWLLVKSNNVCVIVSYFNFSWKFAKNHLSAGSARTRCGSLQRSPRPISWIKGRGGRERRKWRAGEGWEGKSEGVESVNKYWLRACLRLGRLSAVLLCVFKWSNVSTVGPIGRLWCGMKVINYLTCVTQFWWQLTGYRYLYNCSV